MIRAADVMSRTPVTVPLGTSLRDVARLLSRHDASGAPVVDAAGRVVGMISKTDLVDFIADRGELRDALVDDAMSAEIHAIAPDAPLLDAVERMVFEGVHRVLVLDAAGDLVGLVSGLDVLRAVARGRGALG